MNQYVKPIIKLAGTTTNSSSAGSCYTKADMELIAGIVGPDVDINTAFGPNEACVNKLPIDMYCKFTSAELGAAQAFVS